MTTNSSASRVPNQSLKLTEVAVDDFARAKQSATIGLDLPRADWICCCGASPPQLSSDPLGGSAFRHHKCYTQLRLADESEELYIWSYIKRKIKMRQVIVYPGEDEYWVAECPSLPGCVSQVKLRKKPSQTYGKHRRLHYCVTRRPSTYSPWAIRSLTCCGMSSLPRISGRECTKSTLEGGLHLETSTWQPHDSPPRRTFSQLVVPDHHELDRGTLRAIIRQANISVEQFTKLFVARYSCHKTKNTPLTPSNRSHIQWRRRPVTSF